MCLDSKAVFSYKKTYKWNNLVRKVERFLSSKEKENKYLYMMTRIDL